LGEEKQNLLYKFIIVEINNCGSSLSAGLYQFTVLFYLNYFLGVLYFSIKPQ